jgi:O-antigen ligase
VAEEGDRTGVGVPRLLACLVVLTLPFTAALTLNLRFPLKIYEIGLLAAALTCLVDFRIPTLRSAADAATWVIALVGWALVVLLLHLWWPPAGLNPLGFESRFGPVGDGIAKLLYLLLSLFGFLLVARQTFHDEALVLRLWLIGAVIAAGYSWYLFASSLLGISPFLLPGIETPQLYLFADRVVIRSGTFEEGNFFGLYLLVSTMIAIYARRPLIAAFVGATVLTTFSTVNFAAFALIALPLLFRWIVRRRPGLRAVALLASAVAAAGIVALLLASGYLTSVLSAKLAGPESVSRLDRLGLALAGLRMFQDHPLTGVGISQYGYYYRSYELFNLSDWSIFFAQKRIANNVYVELLAELGIVGLLLFGGFLSRIWRHLRGPEMLPLRLGFLGILLVWNAFPSYSIMFLWAFWGVILGVSARAIQPTTFTTPSFPSRFANIR